MASMVTPRRGRRSSHLSQRRSATMSMGTPNRASFTAAPEMVIKSSYQCRGLRKWCHERCERSTKSRPKKYPQIGYYCSLHKYQAPDIEEGFTDLKMKRWVERLPSFAEFKTVEKEKETVVSGDQELVTALKQARPPVIRDIRVRGILHANCFKGEDFMKWAAGRAKDANIIAILSQGQDLLEHGIFNCVTDSSHPRFQPDMLYQLAEHSTKGVEEVLRLGSKRCATVRVAIIAARGLGRNNKKKTYSNSMFKATFRQDGAKSGSSGSVKIGQTIVVYGTRDPQYSKTIKGQHWKIHPADHRLLSKIVSPKFVKWERLFEPKTPPKEWNQLEMDEHTFEVRVPQPVMVYTGRPAAMSFDKSPADIVLDCFHVRKQKAMQMTSTLHDSNRFMGEVTISVAGMVRPGSESGKPVVMEWLPLKDPFKRAEGDVEVGGEVLVRYQMLCPNDGLDEFEM